MYLLVRPIFSREDRVGMTDRIKYYVNFLVFLSFLYHKTLA